MALTYLHSAAVKLKLVFWRKVAVSVVLMAAYGWFIVAGVPRPGADVMHDSATQLQALEPRSIRLDTAVPGCDSPEVINGVLGLLRSKGGRIIGLSDLSETGHKPNGDRTCEAVVNLAFGTQRISYTLERIGQRSKAWELSVMLR